MNLTIACPSCGVELTVPEAAGGRRLRCPKCATRFHAPGASASPSPHRPAASPPKKAAETAPKKPHAPPPPPARHREDDLPVFSGDLRDLDDLPLLGEPSAAASPKRPPVSVPATANVEALFADDDPPRPSRRPSAENRKQARRCPDCGGVVPVGMSLCNACGLDLDTGVRIELEEDLEEAPAPEVAAGPPVSLLVVGLTMAFAAGALAVYAFLKLDSLSGPALGLISLFGVLASILFAAGKSVKMLTTALILGALANILTMIVLPVFVANYFDEVVAPQAADLDAIAGKPKENADAAGLLEPQPFSQKLDMTKITWGIIILLIDGVLLGYINSPGIRRHFERRHHGPVDYGPLMP